MKKPSSAPLAWGLLAPTLFLLGVFIVYPAIYSFYLSAHEIEPFSQKIFFVGWDNYRELATSPAYWRSIHATFLFLLLTMIPSVTFSLAIAVALDSNPYFRGLLRTLFMMPIAISSAMAAMLWIFLYNPTSGYLNYLLESIGIRGPNWLADPNYALLAVAIATVWKEIGFNIIFFLAGLSSVPNELREAALLDGAGPLRRFWNVTLPILSPTLFFVTVVSVINSLQSFGQIHILTNGGPAGSTNTLVYSLYRNAFENFRAGYASSQAVILFFITLAATLAQFAVARRRVHYG